MTKGFLSLWIYPTGCRAGTSPVLYHLAQVTVTLWGSVASITHWGRVTHICVSNLTIIGSDNGLSPGRRQAIIWTNAGILFIGPLGTNFSEILIAIPTLSFKKMRLKVSFGKWQPFCLSLNVVIHSITTHTWSSSWHTPSPIMQLIVESYQSGWE